MAYRDLTPVTVLTGFLGSGKTTLLNRLLRDPALADAAVLINEFGEVGIDHHLVSVIDPSTVLLASGCICCTIRGDLKQAVLDLDGRRARGEVPAFRRLVVETTGLADPAPILATLLSDPALRHHYRLGTVVTTVDAVNARDQLASQPEPARQIAVADTLVLTKTDLAEAGEVARLTADLRALNRSAEIAAPSVPAAQLLRADAWDPATKSLEVQHWLQKEAGDDHASHDHDRHDGITSFCLTREEPLDWTAFGIWLTLLLHARGRDVLRVKGLLNVQGVDTPVVINGVQHIVHPPVHLPAWPDADRSSRVVFIVRDLDRATIERSLAAFNRLAA